MASESDIGRAVQAVYEYGHWEAGVVNGVDSIGETLIIDYGAGRFDTVKTSSVLWRWPGEGISLIIFVCEVVCY